VIDHARHVLTPLPRGGFTISAEGAEAIRAVPGPEGWTVDGPEPVSGWRLTRSGTGGRRFRLRGPAGETERGESSSIPGSGGEGERHLVMEDGRVYRILLRGPEDPRYELLGWETPGAYLTARPGTDAWTIEAEVASSGLDEIRPLLILFAAEILDAGARETSPSAESREPAP